MVNRNTSQLLSIFNNYPMHIFYPIFRYYLNAILVYSKEPKTYNIHWEGK